VPDVELLRVCADFELGLRLADHECPHGRLYGDSSPSCGCWPGEGEKEERAA
jgi:hypothetical protein